MKRRNPPKTPKTETFDAEILLPPFREGEKREAQKARRISRSKLAQLALTTWRVRVNPNTSNDERMTDEEG
ncbi:MAG: hypothetical protein AB9M53_08390 [Leptothrix sp. (in: b-proteobacteria)]